VWVSSHVMLPHVAASHVVDVSATYLSHLRV
jgi:hypothetical protein